ncbi:trigger factor [Glaciecola punicea ACAM 611]|jgi:trigger factor|uniref:Trigger factor n=1 Tax=Glaciecola punicea ACAM 611 TaxID=1121923 RepID=H5T7Z6_9ALTE|nr:trigger factor [Glaciecola punicea]OFA30624.1 trigger factor [Glaciecola punicea]GAB54423.1 trigger factor [Glaciecola punicea ACAM 611]
MQVSVETTQGLERRLTITVPAESVDKAVKSRLQQLAKTQRINGFRPGKVPASVIKKRFGSAVRQEVSGDVMQQHFYQAIMQEELTPAGMPNFELTKDVAGEDLEFAATFEVYPDVVVSALDTLEIEKPVVEIAGNDLSEMMKTLQQQHATFKECKRKAKKGDKLTISFVGSIDGEEFDGGKAEDFPLELGKSQMIPGFEEPLIGAKTGDEVIAELTFPQDYHAEALKGKAASFVITVNKVEGLNLPKIDDEFATLFGVKEGGVEALEAEVKKNMQRELDQTLKTSVKEAVIDALLASNSVDAPKALVDQEVNALREQAKQRFAQQGNGQNLPELPADMFTENAKRRVAVGLLIGQIIKENKVEVDPKRVDALIETTASAYEDPTEVVEYYKNNQELLKQIQNLALEEQAIDTILEKAKVKEVKKSFDEVMNKKA